MTWILGWISATRVIGLAAYAISLSFCVTALVRSRSGSRPPSRLFAGLSAVQVLLLLDMAFDWRWKLHAYGMQKAAAEGVYGLRRSPQLLGLVALLCLALCCVGLILLRLRHRRGGALALAGTVFSVALWAGEAISYHYLDLILYRKLGGVMLVAFIWSVLAGLTCLGAWSEFQSRDVPRRH